MGSNSERPVTGKRQGLDEVWKLKASFQLHDAVAALEGPVRLQVDEQKRRLVPIDPNIGCGRRFHPDALLAADSPPAPRVTEPHAGCARSVRLKGAPLGSESGGGGGGSGSPSRGRDQGKGGVPPGSVPMTRISGWRALIFSSSGPWRVFGTSTRNTTSSSLSSPRRGRSSAGNDRSKAVPAPAAAPVSVVSNNDRRLGDPTRRKAIDQSTRATRTMAAPAKARNKTLAGTARRLVTDAGMSVKRFGCRLNNRMSCFVKPSARSSWTRRSVSTGPGITT
jgi:hypothetical protein